MIRELYTELVRDPIEDLLRSAREAVQARATPQATVGPCWQQCTVNPRFRGLSGPSDAPGLTPETVPPVDVWEMCPHCGGARVEVSK